MRSKKQIQESPEDLSKPEPEIVTRIAQSHSLNAGKYAELLKQAKLLGLVRKEVWQRFGSINGVGVDHRVIRDQWVKTRDFSPLPAKAWKETLRDAMDNIALYEEAAKKKVNIKQRGDDTAITLYMSHQTVKKLLLDRLAAIGGVNKPQTCDRPSRTRVARTKVISTESESSKY